MVVDHPRAKQTLSRLLSIQPKHARPEEPEKSRYSGCSQY